VIAKKYIYLLLETELNYTMQYNSTQRQSPRASLAEAVMQSRADDGGLYMPQHLPNIPNAFFKNFAEMSFAEIAYVLGNLLYGPEISSANIKHIVEESFNFEVPIEKISDNIYSLELFHGPTMTFKDFGARFMARMLKYIPKPRGAKKIHVLVATTGNTGSAIANGFAGIEGVEVYILFPRGRVSRQLESQFTTIGGNIHAYEVQGTIDDCQMLVRKAYEDEELNFKAALTSANSLNIARLLPQTFYYFYGMAKLQQYMHSGQRLVISLPCGNLGNLVGAVISKRMGLPIDRIVACENANSFLTDYMRTGQVSQHKSIPTLAYAADKGTPTNFERLQWLYDNSLERLYSEVESHSYSDAEIIRAVNTCYETTGYTCDPHTALSYCGQQDSLKSGEIGLMLATAHPAKSLDAMTAITGRAMDMPLQLTNFMNRIDKREQMPVNYKVLRRKIFQNM
jgi:threonine synthase